MDIHSLLQEAKNKNASDLHLSASHPPILRIDGQLTPLSTVTLSNDVLSAMLEGIMDKNQRKLFKENWEIDFAYALSEQARFRVNVFQQRRGTSAVFRTIPMEVPTLKALNMPVLFEELCMLPNGIILVTGPTGSGKSTTLAAMVNHLNTHANRHIVTIEDPIEFAHNSKNCLINQREVHRDTKSFTAALRSVLREDPDIILVGEMRDIETIRLALTAAETGHLVLATLHTNSAAKTIDRIIDVFPANEKEMVRAMISESLRAIVAQTLIKRPQGGRVAAVETMICTPAIRNLIRENKIPQIYSAIQTGQSHGMCTMEQSIQKLVAEKIISPPQVPATANCS